MNLIKNNKLIFYSLILGFLGFIDSTYLTILHYKDLIPPCTVTSGCETVLTSKYAVFFGVPIALLGSLFYLAIMITCLLLLTNYKKIFLNGFYLLVASGFVVSLVLIYIQAYLIHAFCQYCLISEATSAGLLVLGYLRFKAKKT